jgi:hypothetical protein
MPRENHHVLDARRLLTILGEAEVEFVKLDQIRDEALEIHCARSLGTCRTQKEKAAVAA